MQTVVTGTITSSDISEMGKLKYGYLGIETDDKEHLKVKVTAFTKFETLDLGAKVTIELESVGGAELLNAKKISIPK
ncbi:MAG: hypothetical protein OEV85_01705 [Candidatus Thorarchaeota archaeon]|nr:hypothetical protein [Candidatus Thorarchaeota archaeon]